VPKVITYRAKDGTTTYRVRVRDALKRQTTETFNTKREAERFALLVKAEGGPAAIAMRARRDTASTEYVPSLREWLPQYIEQLTGVTDRTRLDYAAMAKRTFLPILGDLPLDAIDRSAVAKTINKLEAQGLAAKSIANAHGLLSAVMGSAVMADLIPTNPCHRMRLPRSGEHERRDERFLTHEEYGRLIAAVPEAHRPLVVLLFGTGLRWSEATALQVRDVTLGSPPTLRVVKAWKSTPGQPRQIGEPKSKKSRRTVMLARQVVEALEPLLDRPGDELLFVGARGAPVYHGSWRDRVWVPACIAAGLATPKPAPRSRVKWTFDGPRIHDARHTHASWLIEQGASLEMVQDQLGHESILTTRKVYGHLQPAMRNALAEAATRAMDAVVMPPASPAALPPPGR
jgi:integrase